jgi:hypothetical protein
MDDPALVDLLVEASRRRVCWNVNCTTCGAGELRSGVVLLARRIPLRLVQLPIRTDQPVLTAEVEELPTLEWWRLVQGRRRLTPSEANHLTQVCVEAQLGDLSHAAPFPDWLGYLGIVLDELGRFERRRPQFDEHERFESHRLRTGAEWARQFTTMGGDPVSWARFNHDPMSWRDLELAETEGLGRHQTRDD